MTTPNFASASTSLYPTPMVAHPMTSRVVSSTMLHRSVEAETRLTDTLEVAYKEDLPRRPSEHWLRSKQMTGQPSSTASVADIDAVKEATTASTKGKRIVRDDILLLWPQIYPVERCPSLNVTVLCDVVARHISHRELNTSSGCSVYQVNSHPNSPFAIAPSYSPLIKSSLMFQGWAAPSTLPQVASLKDKKHKNGGRIEELTDTVESICIFGYDSGTPGPSLRELRDNDNLPVFVFPFPFPFFFLFSKIPVITSNGIIEKGIIDGHCHMGVGKCAKNAPFGIMRMMEAHAAEGLSTRMSER
ncbi:hypothetical protein BDR05DRAFT_990737 [Suillus weaverae]|nr:hypothetical protein BDR05DRAFT_990737 [Suillus weaverae]